MLSYIRLPILAGVSSVLFHELIVREKVVFLLTQKGGKASEGNHNFCDFWAKERRLFLRSRKVERNIHIWRLWEMFDILAWNVHYYTYFLCVIQISVWVVNLLEIVWHINRWANSRWYNHLQVVFNLIRYSPFLSPARNRKGDFHSILASVLRLL